ncbi:MAG TPA: ABC transporter substrate-binding protein [Oscillospiraceae bacterium]|nr:ABC transporter substrate-binding protein [Oscillospiraceae bacterium]
MNKKVLVVLLALMMVITMFAACTTTSSETSSVAASSVASSVESTVPSVESVASSVVSTAASSVVSTAASSVVSTAASSVVSTAASSKATSSKTSTAAGTSKIGSNPDYPNLPQAITIVQEMHFGDSTENLEQKKLWEETLSARYGVKIHEDCITKTEVGTVYSARLAAGELTGVVYNYGWSYMFAWYNENAVYPLDEYLKNNKTWNMLPKAAREVYKIGNQIWAVPNGWNAGLTGTSMGMWTQAIRADWVKKLGLADIGYTLDVSTFKDIITAFGKRSSELGVTGIIPILFGGDLYSTWNVFTAFDAFIFDPNSSAGYTYNPDTNCMEDALLRAGARQAIEYVRYFYANGYTPKSTFDSGFSDMRNQLASAKVGSFCLYQGRFAQGGYTINTLATAKYGTTNFDLIGDGYTEWLNLWESTWIDTQLVGNKTKGLYANTAGAGGYCLMVGTPQPAETINFFVDLMYSSENAWLEARFNLLDKAIVREADGTFTRKYFDEAKKVFYLDSNLVGVVETELYPASKYLVYNQGANKEVALKRTKAIIAYNSAMTQAAIAAGRVIILPEGYKAAQNYSPTYAKHSGEIISYQNSFVYDGFMKTSITVDKLFATYKKNMAAVGGDKVLKEANQAWGWVNDYQSYT